MSKTALDGSEYFVTFTDDYSRASTIYCMKNKFEVFDKFQAMAEAQFGCKISKLRGGEYISNEFKD